MQQDYVCIDCEENIEENQSVFVDDEQQDIVPTRIDTFNNLKSIKMICAITTGILCLFGVMVFNSDKNHFKLKVIIQIKLQNMYCHLKSLSIWQLSPIIQGYLCIEGEKSYL